MQRQRRNNLLNFFLSEYIRRNGDNNEEGGANNSINQEEINTNRTISPTQLLLSSNWGQLQNLSPTERVRVINNIRELALIRQRRRMRLSNQSDDEDLNQEEQSDKYIAESDIDFRTYPIKINWFKIENDEKYYFGILSKYGYFGVAIYSVIDTFINRDITISNFLFSILDYFSELYKNQNNFDKVNNFISALPSANEIKNVIETKNFLFKEIAVFIIVLKIFEVYYRKTEKPCYKILVNDVLNAQMQLGEYIEDDSWEKVYSHIKEKDKIEPLLIELKVNLHKTKQKFINHAYKAKKQYYSLVVGINEDQFII